MNPRRLEPYIKADELRRADENYLAWLHGLYVYNAMSVVMANSFSKKKVQYMEEPIPLTQTEADAAYLRKEARFKAQMKAFVERQKNGITNSEN